MDPPLTFDEPERNLAWFSCLTHRVHAVAPQVLVLHSIKACRKLQPAIVCGRMGLQDIATAARSLLAGGITADIARVRVCVCVALTDHPVREGDNLGATGQISASATMGATHTIGRP